MGTSVACVPVGMSVRVAGAAGWCGALWVSKRKRDATAAVVYPRLIASSAYVCLPIWLVLEDRRSTYHDVITLLYLVLRSI